MYFFRKIKSFLTKPLHINIFLFISGLVNCIVALFTLSRDGFSSLLDKLYYIRGLGGYSTPLISFIIGIVFLFFSVKNLFNILSKK